MQKHILQCLLDLMSREQRGEVIHKEILRITCQMLKTVSMDGSSVYKEQLENASLQKSAEFYILESQKNLSENTIAVYIKKIEAYYCCIHQEN